MVEKTVDTSVKRAIDSAVKKAVDSAVKKAVEGAVGRVAKEKVEKLLRESGFSSCKTDLAVAKADIESLKSVDNHIFSVVFNLIQFTGVFSVVFNLLFSCLGTCHAQMTPPSRTSN